MKARRWLILAALAAFTLAVGAAAQDVPLGDVARKNRKDPNKAKKVITNEDIPESASAASAAPASGGSASSNEASAAPPAEPPVGPAGAAAQAGGGQGAAVPTEDPVDEEITQLKGELDALKKEAGVGVRSIEKLEEQLKSEDLSPARRQTYEDILSSGVQKVGSLENQITQKEQALQQAEEKKKAKAAAARPATAAPAPK